MPAQNLDPIGAVAAQVVAENPELRGRLTKLVNALIADAEHTVKYGTTTERAALMKTIVPSLLRSMQSAESDALDEDRRRAYERMMAMSRGEIPPEDGS